MSSLFSAALAAKQAAAGDRTTWCQHAVTDLGASRIVEFKTFSAAPGNWQTGWTGLGTTFYAAPLSGSMTIDNGVITGLGTVGIPTAEANAVLSSGFAAIRVSGAGAWMQATVGLPDAIGYDGQPVSIVLRKNLNGTYGIVLNSARFAAPTSLPLSPVVELHRRVLTNESAGVQSSGFVTQMFGEFFEQGEVPAGTHPQWRTVEGDLLCPSTVGSHVRWPDGSLRWCGVILAVPQSVPAAGTIEIAVKSGGNVPAPSSRTLADAATHNINVLVSGVTGLTGDWTVALNTGAATPANVVKIADGAAGAVFRVQEDFQQAGSPHGQLICWHYVQVLQNAAGAYAGTRYLGRVALPWCDVGPSPAAILGPQAQGMAVTAALRTGATLRRQLQGMSAASVQGNEILLPHYGSIATCGADALYDFFPGAQATECVVRVKPAGKKAARARLISPYDFSLTPTASTLRNFVNHGNGTMIYATGVTGERGEIALIPNWAAKYIIGDPANSEREVRVNAMVTTGWVSGARRKSTGALVPTANFTQSYVGLGANQPTWRWGYAPSGGQAGITNFALPTNNTKLWVGEVDEHHRGAPCYSAYLFTAEPQYLDLLTEHGANFVGILPQGAGTTWTTVQPQTDAYTGAFHSRDQMIGGVSYPGAGIVFRSDIERYAAWGLRDVSQGAAIYPDVCPYGTEIKKYLKDVSDSNVEAFVAYKNLMPQSYRDNGLMLLKQVWEKGDEPWAIGYLANSYSNVYNLLGNPAALECATHLSKFWISIDNDPGIDLGAGMAYVSSVFNEAGNRIMTVNHQFYLMQYTVLTYSIANNNLTFTASTGSRTYGFENGDVLRAPAAGYVEGAIEGTWLYMVNKSGQSFQVSLTPGGPPATILKDEAFYGPRTRIANLAPNFSYEFANDSNSYLASVTSAWCHMASIGVPNLAPLISEGKARLTAAGTMPQFAANPKNALVSSIPSEA